MCMWAPQGRVILISSLAGKIVQPKEGAYAASKHAVEALGDALRQELARQGVSVSIIEPGFVDTPILDKVQYSCCDIIGNKHLNQ